ncbi:Putative Holliday junction resolvase YggF [invertebrate metagenome]|uniref:Holliday junction resolvase YggF n=1 Tax=invertebrate metagenome TaxID=1711999 RepID=A0A484H5U4_9ZZZZ
MTIHNLSQLNVLLKPGQRLLGLDLGGKSLGLALSDVSLTVATPFVVIKRRNLVKDKKILFQIMHRQNVGGLVVGLPLQMNGMEGSQAVATLAFVRNLSQQVEIALFDERLSSAAVERMLITEADLSRQRRRQVTDKVAAAYILQGALDFLKNTA